MTYIKSYTSLRGIAAWWVVFYHFRESLPLAADGLLHAVLELGYVAVDFFFILSGFVIYLSYSQLLRALNPASLIEFFIKRLARVYPLYLVMALAYLSVPLAYWITDRALPDAGRFAAPYYLALLGMVQNWGGFDTLAWNIPAWSISTEFAAYLAFPLLLWLCNRLPSVVTCFLGIAALSVGIAFMYFASGLKTIGEDIPGLGVMRCVFEFSIGMLVARIHSMADHASSRATLAGWLVMAVLLYLAIAHPSVPNYVYIPGIFTLLIYLLSMQPRWGSFLSGRALVYLGEISYSTYLCHYLVKDWVKLLSDNVGALQFCVYIIVIIGLSHILYQWIEVPGRRWGRSFLLRMKNAG